MLLLLVARQLDLGADGYGYLLGAMGLGGIAGAALGGRLAASGSRATVLVGALLVVAASLPLLAVTHSIALALVIAFVNGMGALVVEVLAETGLQLALADAVLGRAYGFALSAALAGIVAGSLLAPLLIGLAGVGGALTILGAAVALISALLARPPRTAAPMLARAV